MWKVVESRKVWGVCRKIERGELSVSNVVIVDSGRSSRTTSLSLRAGCRAETSSGQRHDLR